jgi:hypothetical protein
MQVHPGFIAAREASLKLMRKKQLKIMQPGQLMRLLLPPNEAKGGEKKEKNMARKAEI